MTLDANATRERDALLTAQAAAAWWGERLNPEYAHKRAAFVAAIERQVATVLSKTPRSGYVCDLPCLHLNVDYDRYGTLLEIVRKTVDPKCSFLPTSGILPYPASMTLHLGDIVVKEKGRGFQNLLSNPTLWVNNPPPAT